MKGGEISMLFVLSKYRLNVQTNNDIQKKNKSYFARHSRAQQHCTVSADNTVTNKLVNLAIV